MSSQTVTPIQPRPVSNIAWLHQLPDDPERLFLPFVLSPGMQAGFPSPAADYVEEPLDLHELLVSNPPATFYTRVCGESLVDLGIMDRDIAVVDRSKDALPGRVIVAVADGDFYIKVLGYIHGRPALLSRNEADNASYPPIYLDQVQDYEIFGVVTGVVRKL